MMWNAVPAKVTSFSLLGTVLMFIPYHEGMIFTILGIGVYY